MADIMVLPRSFSHVTIIKGAEVNLNSTKRLTQTLETLSHQDIPYRAGIFDISNITHIDREAREYLASGNA